MNDIIIVEWNEKERILNGDDDRGPRCDEKATVSVSLSIQIRPNNTIQQLLTQKDK